MLRIRNCNGLIRLLSTEATPKPAKVKKSAEYKIAADLLEYFAAANEQDLLAQFAPKLLHKKHKFPDSYYIANREAAETIAEHLTKPATSAKILLESNPGPGLLTEHLVRSGATKIHLFERNEAFEAKLAAKYADQSKRVKVHCGDLVNMWKIGFQDRMDNGKRVQELLTGMPNRMWTGKPVRLFAAVGSLNFFVHLIYSIVRQGDLFTHGRYEMFLAVPPPLYIHLTCNKDAGYLFYRANSILFQIMFEHQYLMKFPKKWFLPWQYDRKSAKHQRLSKIYSIDQDYLYFIKITPRAEIYDLCPLEYMQALLYFVKQNCLSRKHRVIPTLEKWAPGCGPRLIINPERPALIKRLHGNEIPQYSNHCITMSNQDFYKNMNIFTEFGDLTASQVLTLFDQFRQWPEFKESPFLASLENSLLKMETSEQEANMDGFNLQEEEYVVAAESKTQKDVETNS